ncbi:MAG: DUF2007 domain-containing protein [Dehalococcoidia bacterium]
MKWEFLESAPDQITAEIWCDLLTQQGITAMIEPRDAVSFLGVSSLPCRILVPEDMLEEARELLRSYIGDGE